jgi:hypothetical protein
MMGPISEWHLDFLGDHLVPGLVLLITDAIGALC